MAAVLRRPKKEMMLAVNAAIDGKRPVVAKLVEEHGLSRSELDRRLELREGVKYDMTRKAGRTKSRRSRRGKRSAGPTTATETRPATSVLDMIDGRTRIATLIQLEAKVEALLAKRDPKEVDRVRRAASEVDQLRAQLAEAEELLRG